MQRGRADAARLTAPKITAFGNLTLLEATSRQNNPISRPSPSIQIDNANQVFL